MNRWPVPPLLEFAVIHRWSHFYLQKASVILIDFIAAHKCVFLYAAWSTLFLIGLFLFTQLFQAIQKMESELFSFASTFLLVKKYKINNHKLHTMYWNWFSFVPSLFWLLTLSI